MLIPIKSGMVEIKDPNTTVRTLLAGFVVLGKYKAAYSAADVVAVTARDQEKALAARELQRKRLERTQERLKSAKEMLRSLVDMESSDSEDETDSEDDEAEIERKLANQEAKRKSRVATMRLKGIATKPTTKKKRT